MIYQITRPSGRLEGEITLPASKSISNRVLIINALSYSPYTIDNLSDSDDTRVMSSVLNASTNEFDIGHAGTAMRFLTAFLSKIMGQWTLTGSERMKQRPIGILVDALRKLGAVIDYVEEEGYPPLRITGTALKGGVLELDGSVSSQYISALLMIAPSIQNGLTLRLKNKIASRPYIELTLKLMKKFGVRYIWKGNEIRIEEQTYKPVRFSVEADWSGASYWYQIAAMTDDFDLLLKGLRLQSLQGDAILAKWFDQYFGVQSKQEGNDVRITRKETPELKRLDLNFVENPDVAQTFAVLCVAKRIPFHFTGLHTLKIKETDRIAALQNECAKLGAKLAEPQQGEIAWDGILDENIDAIAAVIDTYHDHRMALAFAPAALVYDTLKIADPMVVTKSYPDFYEDLKKVGFSVQEVTE
ncbi:3-phosphoshikimate 1-carboxyvinyltransferase [Prolixibacter bellariivorans]|uniref:3-phosphoshikimate 1-carboxyvinyltransferase n=1 Tax=Prolixibacter bellariivorans TaxID=314319 RepID=A0A5M4AZ60_9BACT|nr:3-phosphoshikimate 1-carboxyvinyltransferase [Prolixibacter bellariivorans]GET33074.1 3-phosphoshikimate 1-carboxyvinyltransferase [Prolixibacter bellariivorans]